MARLPHAAGLCGAAARPARRVRPYRGLTRGRPTRSNGAMTTIATLTLNPTIDVAYEVDRMFHTRKMRTQSEFYSPGGGGISVARVFARLGGGTHSYYLAGGATGDAFDGLLDGRQLARTRIPIAGHTRISSAVFDLETGKEYRFVPPGPTIAPSEWRACLDLLDAASCRFLVASGSLPPGMPDDFYGQIIARMHARGVPVALDSSGPGLKRGLAQGGVFLVKPSVGELRQLTGRALADRPAILEAAMDIVRSGQAEHVAVTMGHEGAILASADVQVFQPAAAIAAKSAVGAGDSFLAAMVFALSRGWTKTDAFRFGVAGGGAAVISPGHDLASPADIERLYRELPPAI